MYMPDVHVYLYIQMYRDILKFAKLSGLKHPEALTSTKLRKHIATMSQVMNLQDNELDLLSSFLGRDIRVLRRKT